MSHRSRRRYAASVLASLLALATGIHAQMGSMPAPPADGILPSGFGEPIDLEIERARAATAQFRTLANAVAAGYAADVSQCIDNPPHGAMGFHHQNDALLDDRLEVERPEILVYERLPNGEYRFNGVEYIVPLKAWTRDEPPAIMGQPLKKAPSLGIWYLHVWIWQKNPSGVFADWNPAVKC